MNKCGFISGHRDVTDEEFNKYYKPQIDEALKNNVRFVVCDYVDTITSKDIFTFILKDGDQMESLWNFLAFRDSKNFIKLSHFPSYVLIVFSSYNSSNQVTLDENVDLITLIKFSSFMSGNSFFIRGSKVFFKL